MAMSGGSIGEREREYLDVVYSILADEERRAILRDLASNDTSRTISDLVQRIPERRDEAPSQVERALRIRLHHQHLPKMADAGAIDYDDGRVTLTPLGEEIETTRKQITEVVE